MQEKLIEILSRATAWMTAQQIADAGGWRSASNVTVALQQMEKANGKVEHRKSQTELMANVQPATEWKLTDKQIKEATESKMGRKPKHTPLEKVSSEADALRKQIADMHAESAGLCSLIEEQRNQIAKLNEQLMHGTETVDVKNAKGYLVCAPKRKPAKLMKADSAVERAKAAAKATGRSELFALVPVGVAARKRMNVIVFQELAA
jgi:uncharacterized coiled-coil DUF342 family protein